MNKSLKRYARTIYRLLPKHPLKTKIAMRLGYRPIAPTQTGSISYEHWIKEIEPQTFNHDIDHAYKPTISIVVPTYNTPDKYLIPMIDSVLSQIYSKWQLVLVDGCDDTGRSAAVANQATRDDRIRLVKVGENRGIVGNTNVGLSQASGEFIGFLDHDDTLSPQALNEIVVALNQNRHIGLFYSDEDKLSEDGHKRSMPIFKPDWSPDMLTGINYMAHFIVARKTLVEEVGGLRDGFDGSQDYDFLLRVIEKQPIIHHIPKVLYHFRFSDTSTASDISKKTYADVAGKRALGDYVKRNHISADVLGVPDRPTNYRLKYAINGTPLVSIIIPFKDRADLLRQCIDSLATQTYQNIEFILVSNNSTEAETLSYLDKLALDPRMHVVIHDQPFNWSQVNNVGRRVAKGEYLLFLNNDTEALHKELIAELLGVAQQTWSGVVGAWLFYPDKTTQHAGVTIPGQTTMAINMFRRVLPSQWTDFGMPDWPRNYLAVTGACQMVKAKLFDELGGFDEQFIICGSDVVFCLKVHEAGYRNVYWPYARMTHYESLSVKSYDNAPVGDYERSLTFYRPYFDNGDPFYSPNLSRTKSDLSPRETLA